MVKYAPMWNTRKQAMKYLKSMAIKKEIKRRGYVYGVRGGKIPLSQARIFPQKMSGGKYIVIAKRKRRK